MDNIKKYLKLTKRLRVLSFNEVHPDLDDCITEMTKLMQTFTDKEVEFVQDKKREIFNANPIDLYDALTNDIHKRMDKHKESWQEAREYFRKKNWGKPPKGFKTWTEYFDFSCQEK